MTKQELFEINQCALEFRHALDEIDKKQLACNYRRFPTGTCGITSYMLCEYLAENGHKDFNYVCGQKGEQTHAWLEKDGTIIDITSDQFPDGTPVYVGDINEFYQRFTVNPRFTHGMIDSRGVQHSILQGDMLWMYPRIIDQIYKNAKET